MAKDNEILPQETIDTQRPKKDMRKAERRRIFRSTDILPDLGALSAIVDGELAAAIITARMHDACNIPFGRSHRLFWDKYVNHTTFFAMGRDIPSLSTVETIFCNVRSPDSSKNVDKFNLRMSFMANTFQLCVAPNPLLKFLANNFSFKAFLKLHCRNRANYPLTTTPGMLAFYLQAKCPPRNQSQPECMVDRNTTLLQKTNIGVENIILRAQLNASRLYVKEDNYGFTSRHA
jgi:hypothetical protein